MKQSLFPIQTIHGFLPSEYLLLEMCCDLMDEEMISFIAKAHYGYGEESNFEVLKQIIASRKFSQELEPGVHEVIQLRRWSSPETNNEHIARMLCCVYLLNLNENTTYDECAEEASLATLIESAIAAGPEFYEPTLQFVAWKTLCLYERELAWLAEEEDDDDDDIGIDGHCILALLLLAVLNKKAGQDIAIIFNLLDDEMHLNELSKTQVVERLTTDSATRSETWKTITRKIFSDLDFISDERLKSELAEIANTFH